MMQQDLCSVRRRRRRPYGLNRHHLDAALAERFVMVGGELLTWTGFSGHVCTLEV